MGFSTHLPKRQHVTAIIFVCWVLAATQPIGATDPMRTALIVNANSTDSLTIANHYASLRGIPDRCIVTLDNVPKEMSCGIEEMKASILKPMLAELDKRGLGNQTDIIAYSADFPTAINLNTDFAKVPPRHHLFTPVGSINGLTTLYQFLGDEQVRYVAPRTNFYSRVDVDALQQNPFISDDRKVFEDALMAAKEQRFTVATDSLKGLIKKHPQQWPLRLRLAGYQVLAEQVDDGLETISAMLRDRVAYRLVFENDSAFDKIREHDVFVKLLAAMPPITPNRIPPMPFSGRTVWGQNGLPLGDATGPRYLLSVVLAVTKARGTSLDEAIEILTRAADADATGGPATFYFSNSDDVRSTTRFPLMPIAVDTLRQLGHDVIINKDRLPKEQKKLMGAMLGSANYDWPLAFNTLLPGSIADNLTSTSGVLHQADGQTSMVELLRGGAAGTSGTVTEPYALQFKFPTPLMYAYYAAGTTLAEAFYLSVDSPYQLLIVGDPLCRPYGDEHNEAFSLENITNAADAFSIRIKFWRPFKVAAAKVNRFEIYFGGQLALATKPVEALRINSAGLPRGWHEVTVVAVSKHPVQMKTLKSTYVLIGDEKDCPKIEAKTMVTPENKDEGIAASQGSIAVKIDSPGASRIAVEHQGRRLIDTEAVQDEFKIDVEKTGYGPVRLTPLAMHNEVWIPGKPIVIDVPMPIVSK